MVLIDVYDDGGSGATRSLLGGWGYTKPKVWTISQSEGPKIDMAFQIR